MRYRLPADALLLVTVLIWSGQFVVVRYALTHGFSVLPYAALRFAAAGAIFAGFTTWREGDIRVTRRDTLFLVGLAGVGIYVNQLGFVYSIEIASSVGTVALCFGTLPVFVALVASAFRVERLRRTHWLAALVSFGGVALVAAGASGGIGGDVGGILLALLAVSTWAAYSVAIGPLMRRYTPYRVSAVVLLAGTVPLVATAVPSLVRADWGSVEALAWVAFAYTTLLALVLTNVLWFTAIERVGAARSALYANLQPFLGALFAYLLLSEGLSLLQVAGGVVIAAGIALARQPEPRAAHVD